MGFFSTSATNGLIWMNSTMGEVSRSSGVRTSGGDVITINGRVYVAYTAYSGDKKVLLYL